MYPLLRLILKEVPRTLIQEKMAISFNKLWCEDLEKEQGSRPILKIKKNWIFIPGVKLKHILNRYFKWLLILISIA